MGKAFRFQCHHRGKYGHKHSNCRLLRNLPRNVESREDSFMKKSEVQPNTVKGQWKSNKPNKGNVYLVDNVEEDVEEENSDFSKQLSFMSQTENTTEHGCFQIESCDQMSSFVDSGVSEHMINSERYFSSSRVLDEPIKVAVKLQNLK